MTFYIFILSALLLVLAPEDAMSQSNRGLILLGNLHQAFNLSYGYNGQTSESEKNEASSQDHLFSEAYRFDIDYALYTPRLLKGHLFAEIRSDQELFSNTNEVSGSSSGLGFRYNITGTFLERDPYPITFFSSSGLSKVQRAFASSFDLETDNYGAGFFLKSKYLPVQFSFNRNKSVTSGLANNREQVIDNYLLNAKHKAGEFSLTEADLIFSSFNATTQGQASIREFYTSNDFSIRNLLTWSIKGQGGSLTSGFKYKQEAGDRELNSLDFSESLSWDFGKALKAGARFTRSSQEGKLQTRDEDSGELSLRHLLFQNLQTTVHFSGRDADFTFGNEREWNSTIGVDYQKKLPAESHLQLGYTRTYGVVDRNLSSTSVSINNEVLIASFDVLLLLANPDIIQETIVIRNADPQKRIDPYVLNADYTVEQIGRLTAITINPAGLIPEGETLVADYDVKVDPSVKYDKNVQRLYGTVLVYDGRYRVFASLDDYRQNLLSGVATTASLLQARTYRAGLEFKGKSTSLRAEYANDKSTLSVYQSLDVSFRYKRDFNLSSLSLYLKDRITLRENPPSEPVAFIVPGTVSTGTGMASDISGTDNSFNAGAIYQRSLMDSANLKLTTNYLNTSGRNRRDAIAIGMGLQARFGRIFAELTSEAHWLITKVATRRDDLVRLDITRYF